ncbi:hypothetical protein CTI14_70075, partial [Methylobacterium radiotolerans]
MMRGGSVNLSQKLMRLRVLLQFTLVLIACLAVAAVLVLGLANMMRGGSVNLSQKLMRLRVLLQF